MRGVSSGPASTTRSQTMLLVSAATGVGTSLLLTVLAGRSGSTQAFGLFALVAAFLALTRDLADLGTTAVTVRTAVHDPTAERRALEELLGWRLIMSGVVALAAVVFAWIQPGMGGRLALLATALAIVAMHANGMIAVFQLRHMLEWPALINAAAQGVAAALAIVAYLLHVSPIGFAAIVIAREFLIVVASWRLAVRLIGYRPRLRRAALRLFVLLGATSTYACAALLFHIILNSGTFLVRLFADADTFAAYVAAYRLMTPAFSLPWILTAPLVPLLARAAADPTSFATQVDGSLLFACGGAAVLAVAGAVLAPDLLVLIYAGRFSQGALSAVAPLRLLMLAFIGVAATAVRAPALLAQGRETGLLWLAAVAAMLTLALQLLFIPRWGAAGGAGAAAVGALLAGLAPVGTSDPGPGIARILLALLPALTVGCVLLVTPIGPGFGRIVFGTVLSFAMLAVFWRLPAVVRGRAEQRRWAMAHG